MITRHLLLALSILLLWRPELSLAANRQRNNGSIKVTVSLPSIRPNDLQAAASTQNTSSGSSASASADASVEAPPGRIVEVEAAMALWQLNSTAVPLIPWEVPSDVRLPYEGLHNNIEKLLAVQADSHRRFTLIILSGPVDILQQCVASLLVYGRSDRYIVATPTADDLANCRRLRLPCLNASKRYKDLSSRGKSAGSNFHPWMLWLKVVLLEEILDMGYTVHFSDSDNTYIRAVWPSYLSHLNRTAGDASFMREVVGPRQTVNTGNFVLLPNARTKRLVKAWLAKASPGRGRDQGMFNSLKGQSFQFCGNVADCTKIRKQGLVALARHPTQQPGNCPPRHPVDACTSDRLYIHAICIKGNDAKSRRFKQLGLWMLPEADAADVSEATRLKRIRNRKAVFGDHTTKLVLSHPPCKSIAWHVNTMHS